MADYIKRTRVGGMLGDHVNTDVIYPARYLVLFAPDEVKKHLFEDISPELAQQVSGCAVLGGIDFGCGSAREQGLTALKYAGVEMLVCKSYSRAFYRNGFNNAVPLFIADCQESMDQIAQVGHEIEANFTTGLLTNLTTGKTFQCSPTPAFLLDLLLEGGIWNYYCNHSEAYV
ncbi:MAG: 3-isopropylmalate dehydratase [Clostridia bacterium]|nr:3-isopropylmalate dehydratase [Clostridia bacterium]